MQKILKIGLCIFEKIDFKTMDFEKIDFEKNLKKAMALKEKSSKRHSLFRFN